MPTRVTKPITNRPKPLMRNLGEFFGHIVKSLRSDPDRTRRQTVRREVEQEEHTDVILRRTTIEEIEFKPKSPSQNE